MQDFKSKNYPYGFQSNIVSESFKKGLSKETIVAISKKRNEPKFILDFRLQAFKAWQKMKEPHLETLFYPPLDYQDFSYYSEPQTKTKIEKIEEVDPEIKKNYG